MNNNNDNSNTVEPFKVYVRIRPFLDRELTQLNQLYSEDPNNNKNLVKSILTVENNTLYLNDPYNGELYGKNVKAFPFDSIFTEKDDNKSIFNKIIKKLVDNILNGFNSTALAYGVTGTGKTHTMFGDIYHSDNNEKGISMYAVDYLFNRINKETEKSFITKMSYLEIYNEQAIDLLTENPSNEGIMIVEDPNKGVIVPELTQIVVNKSSEVLNYIVIGNQRRTMGPTGVNQFSSRSHAILEISIEQRVNNKSKEEVMNSKLLLVDLAGSERGGLERGIRREEGSNINKSLLALGNCINILADKSKKGSFVPYRDSKLTRLLKDSLGGNISTLMIACVSPSALSYEETNSTLKYASRANKIEKKVTRNVKEVDQYTAQYREIIVSLRNEIAQLKEIIRNQHLLMKLKPRDDYFKEDKIVNVSAIESNSNNNTSNVIYDDFFNADELQKLDYNRVIDLGDLDESVRTENMSSVKANQPMLNCNYEVYDNFLNTKLNNLTIEEFEEFEKKMEGLYFDKMTLEEQIKNGSKDTEINEKYTIVRTFYEKFIELINDKLIENIEQNMILKFNLKEILDLNETNNTNLSTSYEMLKIKNVDIGKIKEDIENYKKNIEDNEKEKTKIQLSLEKNEKIKILLKKLLFKFISNTQMKEIKELKEKYTTMLNEKQELEIKNKKYQEFLATVMKEKEEKSQKIFEISNELEKMKRLLQLRDKRAKNLERILKKKQLK